MSRSWDDANRPVTLCNIYSTIKYEYDDAGLVKTETNTVAGSGGPAVTTFSRYPNGAVSRIVYPNTLSVRRDYNSRGQLSATGWSDSNNNWLATFATYHYLQDGKLDYQDYVNGLHTAFGYDARGLLNQETVSRGNQIYSQRTVYRDDRDRITAYQKSTDSSVNPMENGRGDHYWYDEEGQLTDAYYNAIDPANNPQGPVRNEHFEYDQLGNRHRNPFNGTDNLLAGRGWVYFARKDTGVNEYRSWSPSLINYDDDISHTAGNGVLVAEGSFAASYNALNQPNWFYSGNVNGGFMSFGYDPLGRCVKRWTGGASDPATNPATYFYYDGWNLIQEGPSASAIDRVYMLGSRVDEIVADYAMANGQWIYHHSDARGHSMLLTDSSGNLVEQYEYDAFGQPYFFNAAGGTITYSAYGNRFLFTGREWLSDLKLYDYRNRMYQPELGRFMQPDPNDFAAGDYNLYRYCHNDPVNRTDPTGLQDDKPNLIATGRGDWDFDNGRVAAQMRRELESTSVTGKQVTEAAKAPKSRRPASSRSQGMRMARARDPRDRRRYLEEDNGHHKWAFHQLKDAAGKPVTGYGNYVQEITAVKKNECNACPKGEFPVETSDEDDRRELPRSGLFRDSVGFGYRPKPTTSGILILEQHFSYQHGDEEPVILQGGMRHTSKAENGKFTITVEEIP